MKHKSREEVITLITDVTLRSAKAKQILIFEIGNLNDLLTKESAEQIRQEFVKSNVPINQITNLRKFVNWTANTGLTQNLSVKYVPSETYKITNEILIFDDTVAVYRLDPDPFYFEVTDDAHAESMRGLFMNIWRLGDSLLLAADGSTQTKQFLPISYEFKNIPVVLYPAKDDGLLEKAFSRHEPGLLEEYVNGVVDQEFDFFKDADMILAYVWNQGKIPYCDIWKVNRNDISDDSGFLYDVRIYSDHKLVTDMGVASGNSSIVVTAEEMLLRDLIIKDNLSIAEAANRKRYQARFPVGFVPAEDFYLD
jgi:hypothetical protein